MGRFAIINRVPFGRAKARDGEDDGDGLPRPPSDL